MPVAKARLLLVDDDPVSLETYERILALEGYRVTTAGSGREGLSLLQSSHQFDLVLTDHRMPDVTGLELLIEARSMPLHVPVILYSAFGSTALERAARQLGTTDFRDVLFDADTLVKVVAQGEQDVPTVLAWSMALGLSVTTLKRSCAACGTRATDSLDLARALRLVSLYGGRNVDWYDILEIYDPRTLNRFLDRAGFASRDILPDTPLFLQAQRFVTKPTLLNALGQAVQRGRTWPEAKQSP